MVARLLLIIVTALTTPSCQRTFYITPSHNTTCPGLPCLTLSEYTALARTSSIPNTGLLFMPGNHILNDSILIRNATTFLMSGDSTSLPSLKSVIMCTPLAPIGLDFENVTVISVFALVFTGCGIQQPQIPVRALLHAEYVPNFLVSACSFVDNGFIIALSFRASLAQVSNCSFTNNRARFASGMLADTSYVQFRGSNCFTNNSATTMCSVLYSFGSQITFISSNGTPAFYKNHDENCLPGAVSFVNNSVNVTGNFSCCGGAVCVHNNSVLQVFGKSRWHHNFFHNLPPPPIPPPFFAGGALFGSDSIIILGGNHLFASNHASTGGAIFISKATLNNTGSLRMENNSAYVSGAIHAVHSVCNTYGEGIILSYVNNSAQFVAGSATFFYSRVHIRGNIIVQNNSAEITAMHVHLSNITVYGIATFMNNRAIVGTALYVDTSYIRFVGVTSFVNNVASVPTTLNLHQSTIEFTGNVTFSANRNKGALFALQSYVIINGTALISNNCGSTGGGVWMVLSHLFLYGSVEFESNRAETAGGALAAYNSTVHLGAGNTSFTNNSAPQGGGLFLQALSRLIFNPPLQVYAKHNMADRGAALFVEDVITFNFCSPIVAPLFPLPEEETQCFFSSHENEHHNTSKTILFFENNEATIAGTTLYGGMLDTCLVVVTKQQSKNALQIFKSLSTTLQSRDDSTSEISSDPFQLCFCLNDTNCSTRYVEVFARRGQTIHLHAIAVGQANGSVPAVVRAQFPTITFSDSFLGESEEIQFAGKMCTNLQYTVFSPNNSVEFIMYADGPCRDLGDSSLAIRVHLLPCPIGFQLSGATCICDSTIQPYTTSCIAEDGTIERSSSDRFWIGVVYRNNSYVGLIVHANCPFDYCRNEQIFVNLNNSDSQCSFNRTGVLCGACARNLSLTLGTSHCSHCSSAFVSLLLPFALAGILLIMFLLLLKLTVAVGTINGLIFYANILAVNSPVFFPENDKVSASKLFISWLNLDLGITACFYNGMDAYGKVWLQFLFPAYVWLLMGAVITASHYSSRAARLFGSNPVAVLSTLLLLSYAKMLRTIIAIFSFTFIQYPDEHHEAVWLYDGNVQYLQGKHIPLFIMALVFLLFLFVPYTIYLTFGQCIMAKSSTRPFSWLSGSKIRPFLDAYHSPFSTKHRYWLGLLLLYRCALFLVTAFNTSGDASVNLLTISSSLVGLLALRWLNGMVYKLWYLDALEVLFIVNLGLLSVSTCHVLLAGGNQAILVNLSVGIAFAAFSGILIYHVLKEIKGISLYKWFHGLLVHFKSFASRKQALSSEPTQSEITSEVFVPSTIVPAPQHAPDQLREPLLETI